MAEEKEFFLAVKVDLPRGIENLSGDYRKVVLERVLQEFMANKMEGCEVDLMEDVTLIVHEERVHQIYTMKEGKLRAWDSVTLHIE